MSGDDYKVTTRTARAKLAVKNQTVERFQNLNYADIGP